MSATKKTFILAGEDYGTSQWLITRGYVKLDKDSVMRPDFVVFTGGADVSPELYFEKKDLRTHCDKLRDLDDIYQLAAARLYGIPCVGICRGVQFLHVMSGGTLEQHIYNHAGPQHNVIGKNGAVFPVTSSHHQCVDRFEYHMYEEVYFAEDGTVEAVVSPRHNWGGVQWHPEYPSAKEECQQFFVDIIETLTAGVF